MLDRNASSDTRKPSANNRRARNRPEPAIHEYDDVWPGSAKQANPIPQKLRSLRAGHDLHVLIGTQPLTEEVHLETEYAKLNAWPAKPPH
jgi:hypothetical protein